MHKTEKSLLDASKAETGKISSSLYELIIDVLPIASVEAIISKDNLLLFLRRNNSPAKGQWWFPGGRIRKGETLEEALYREVKEETGLEVIKSKLVNVYSRIFNERHDITIAYLCNCKGNKIILNNEHTEYKYFKSLPKTIHPYIIQVIQDLRKKRNKRSS
ncbi:NUDIX hydrolase [bacterium]|nr:MAG: NUDIX hydrolase [bacterium]